MEKREYWNERITKLIFYLRLARGIQRFPLIIY